MKNKKIILIIVGICLGLLIGLFLTTGGKRTDVYLKKFEFDKENNVLTLNIGVSSSAGYIRKIKKTSGSMNYYLTFYSTFGINSKLGAKDIYEIKLDNNVDEIYFYTGRGGYKKVLTKDEFGNWNLVKEEFSN